MLKRSILSWCIDGAFVLLLVACLWVTDLQRVLSRVFVWDQFHHWDSLLMLPGWACIHGLGLNTDIISSWGLGAVIGISRCSQIGGGFDYAHVLMVLMVMVIVYYVLLYAFLRVWLGSAFLAGALLALAVKLQMFHAGISPLIWVYPQDTPVRHWFDIPVLFCIWRHVSRGEGKYLAWAAVGIGAALAWVLTSGLCLLAAFWGYLILMMVLRSSAPPLKSAYQVFRQKFLFGLLPVGVMVFLLFFLQGFVIFSGSFWANLFEPIMLVFKGVGVVSFYACLSDRHFFAFITGFAIPLIYGWTLVTMVMLSFAQKIRQEELFLFPLCLYGLAMYIHYLAHATTSHYYAVGTPVVLVMGYWISQSMSSLRPAAALRIVLLICLASWGALLTNIFFVYYPNIFDISRLDWRGEKMAYQTQFHFDQDAALIAGLTAPDERVPVISSFEAQLLMQAVRKPFFYDAPLVTSQINGLAGTSLITQERLDRTINQIREQLPDHIFVEKNLLGTWPQDYAQQYPGILLVLRYIVEHYKPQQEGVYLMAMQRKT